MVPFVLLSTFVRGLLKIVQFAHLHVARNLSFDIYIIIFSHLKDP